MTSVNTFLSEKANPDARLLCAVLYGSVVKLLKKLLPRVVLTDC